eukprot:5807720-Pyramimonas_sp.AAC.2
MDCARRSRLVRRSHHSHARRAAPNSPNPKEQTRQAVGAEFRLTRRSMRGRRRREPFAAFERGLRGDFGGGRSVVFEARGHQGAGR